MIKVMTLMAGLILAGAVDDTAPESMIVSLELSGTPLEKVLEQLAEQTGLVFVLRPEVGDDLRSAKYTARLKSLPLREILDTLFGDSELAWKRTGRRVTLERSGTASAADRPFLEIKNPFSTGSLELTTPTTAGK